MYYKRGIKRRVCKKPRRETVTLRLCCVSILPSPLPLSLFLSLAPGYLADELVSERNAFRVQLARPYGCFVPYELVRVSSKNVASVRDFILSNRYSARFLRRSFVVSGQRRIRLAAARRAL